MLIFYVNYCFWKLKTYNQDEGRQKGAGGDPEFFKGGGAK
jgi:hypothetical protein